MQVRSEGEHPSGTIEFDGVVSQSDSLTTVAHEEMKKKKRIGNGKGVESYLKLTWLGLAEYVETWNFGSFSLSLTTTTNTMHS